MKTILLTLIFILLAVQQYGQELKQSEIDSLMALDFKAFDQDMQGGWRYYANQENFITAASLIEAYLEQHPKTDVFERQTMSWHAGQMLAMGGQQEGAIPLMEESRKGKDDFMLWNPYLDATIAFLKKDRPAFDSNLKAVSAMSNNPNLPLLRILEEHFDKTYREALEAAMTKK